MIIVLSTDEVKFVRRGLSDYKKSCIIDAREILESLGYEKGDIIESIAHKFIINQEIEKKINKAINSKRINQIVYFNHEIDLKLIKNLATFMKDKEVEETKLILFDKDESNVPLWIHFDEIKK